MKKLELENDEISDILDCLDGCSICPTITFKLAAAVGSILDVFGSEPGELLTMVSVELTEESTNLLMAYAIDLYQQQSI